MKAIEKVAILGAGTMGAGIAAACANAGREVLLLDLTADAAAAARQKLTAGKRPVIADETALNRIRTGALDADLPRIANCDWICEAVVEDLSIKRDLFTEVEAARAENSIVSTNTSGIPLRDICRDMPPRLQQDIAVTHFFNPVHIMKLVELVPGAQTQPAVIQTLTEFLSDTLGKGVVHAKDTVNFIGNRIGCMWMLAGLHIAAHAMREDGLDVETVDALTAAPLGLPPTGLFGLLDLIGLDVMHNVGRNLARNLPPQDRGRAYVNFPEAVQKLHDRGQLGRKSGGGFYKLTRHADGGKTMEVFDILRDQWRPRRAVELPAAEQTLRGLFAAETANGRFVRELMGVTLSYAAELVPEISADIVNVDRAMRWGFNWKMGPFEMLDDLGAENLRARLQPAAGMLGVLHAEHAPTFYRHAGAEYLTAAGTYARV